MLQHVEPGSLLSQTQTIIPNREIIMFSNLHVLSDRPKCQRGANDIQGFASMTFKLTF